MTPSLLALVGVTLVAYAVKAATGFGPALVVVAFGSLLVGPVHAVVLAAFLDLASGAGLAWIDRTKIRHEAWRGPAATMAAGAVLGALLLSVIPTAGLTRLVGAGVVAFGVWLVRAAVAPEPSPSAPRKDARAHGQRPGTSPWAEYGAAALGGVSGGLIGVGGPPVIIYYASRLPKQRFRAVLVPILLVAAFARAGTYAVSGQVDRDIVTLVLVSLPALPVGLWMGNRFFRQVPELWFRRVVAATVTVVGLRLLI